MDVEKKKKKKHLFITNKNLCGRDGRKYMRPSARAEKCIGDAGP